MPNRTKTSIPIQTELGRDIGLTTALAIGVGTMIAAGIFTLSGLAIRNVGSAATVSFLLAAVVAGFTALTYCEFVSVYPESGEGYLYARRTFPAPLAYVVGWTLFLGYTSSCAFYLASLSSYFQEFIWNSPFESFAGVTSLIILTLLNIKGTKESGRFQVVVTATKVALLIWFVAGGLGEVRVSDLVAKFNADAAKIGGTSALVFVTFFGFSAIAATAGEVRNPIKTVPRAIFLAMGLVTLLYTLVVLVILAAGLQDYTEAAMGDAAKLFLGPVGGMVIVGGALFSMISAANASILAGSRVTLAMSRLGHLPEEIGLVNARTRTPAVSLLLVSGTILVFKLSLRLENLAHFADTVLLLALILVNAALIVHRRKYADMKRPFRVPLVPLVPALGIVANVYLLIHVASHPAPAVMAFACLLLGVIGFLTWKGTQAEELALGGAPSRIALGRYAINEGQYRILVPLANPENVEPLIGLAAAVARERDGEIVALRVAVVPEQMPPGFEENAVDRERSLLEAAHACAQKHGVPITSLVRVGHNAARAILTTARERECNLILLGWKGHSKRRERILGEVVDAVVTHARRDIMLVKLVGDQPIRNILLPTAGGDHARRAEEYAASIVRYREGSLTVCTVAAPDQSLESVHEVNERLKEALGRVSRHKLQNVKGKVLRHASVADAILHEAENYDAIIVGAAGGSVYPQILFGSIPEAIAKNAPKPVIVVKYYHPVKALLGRVMGE